MTALAAILLVVLVAGCGGGGEGQRSEPARRAADPAPKRPQIDLRARPADVAARSSIPILCYHQIRAPTAADAPVDRA